MKDMLVWWLLNFGSGETEISQHWVNITGEKWVDDFYRAQIMSFIDHDASGVMWWITPNGLDFIRSDVCL